MEQDFVGRSFKPESIEDTASNPSRYLDYELSLTSERDYDDCLEFFDRIEFFNRRYTSSR